MDEALRAELLAMDADDQRVRNELAADGSLFQGYDSRMEAVHVCHASRLKEIISRHGWPGRALAGEDGAFAAWRMLQHSISDPAFMRNMLPILWACGMRGDIPLWHAAYLEDRIRMHEGRPQLYGTQFQQDENGDTHAYQVEDPDKIDERRAAVGLGPFAIRLAAAQAEAEKERKHAPKDYQKFMQEYEAWLKRVGWR
jgi:hypothetical protein